MNPNSRQKMLAYGGLVLATLFWAGNAVLARAVADEIPPFTLAFWRWVFALLVVLPFGLPHLRGGAAIIRANRSALFWHGLLSVGAFNTLLYIAAQTTTAINITLVNSTMPVAIAIFARFLLDQRTTRRQVMGFAAAGVGMLLIVAQGDAAVLTSLTFRRGDLIMIGAVIVWGIYSVLLRLWRVDLHPIGFLTVTIVVGVALLFPFFLWEVATIGHPRLEGYHAPMLIYLAIFPSLLAFLFWNQAVEVVGPSATGMFIYLVPVFTAALASTLLGERLQGYHALGGAFILLGLYLATRNVDSRESAPISDGSAELLGGRSGS